MHSIKTVTVDVTSWPSQVAAFQQILTWSNNLLDIVVPAAGILLGRILDFMPQDTQDLSETPPEPPVSVFDVNLKGVYYTADLALFYFRKIHAKQPQQQQSASFRPQLLFLASLAAYGEMAFRPDYDAAKMGVRMMWKTLRRNTAWCGGMQTNLLAPTFINTDMLHADVELLRQRGVKVGEVRDVVDAALRCICDPSIDGK